MRVGLVIYGSLETISGGYLYDRKLVSHLRAWGEQVEIVSLPWRGYPAHLADNLSAAWLQRLRRLQVDLLLQDELNHPSLAWANTWLRRRVHYPIVSIVHHLRASEIHPAWALRLYRWVEARYLRSVDAFIFNSQTTRRTVERLSGQQAPFVVAYPAGDQFHPPVETQRIDERARQPGPLRILFVGNLIPRKGLHILLQSLADLPANSWRLEVVGRKDADPAYAARLRRQVHLSGLQNRVIFLGSLGQAELQQVFERSQVLVVPSSYEGFGIVYLEAMCFGLPAIATTGGAAGEVIADGEDGYLVAPNQPAALAQRLEALFLDRQLLARLGIAARRRYLAHPTWEQTARRIHQFLRDLTSQ